MKVGLLRWLSSKESACHVGDEHSIPESGGCPGGGRGNPLQHSCLKNPMDREAWPTTVQGGHEQLDMTEVAEHTDTHTHRSKKYKEG